MCCDGANERRSWTRSYGCSLAGERGIALSRNPIEGSAAFDGAPGLTPARIGPHAPQVPGAVDMLVVIGRGAYRFFIAEIRHRPEAQRQVKRIPITAG